MREQINHIFNKERADKTLFSALFYGPRGTGKKYVVYEIIKSCSTPEMDEKILAKKSADILEFSGNEGIQTFRELLPYFNTPPKELPHKWVILDNLDFASKEVCSFLLKTLEEKRTYHVFMLATYKESLNPALLSRLHAYKFTNLSKEDLVRILSLDKSRTLLLKYLDKYPFNNIFEVRAYFKYSLEEVVGSILSKANSISEIMRKTEIFLKKVEEFPFYEQLPTVLFFLDFLLARIKQNPEYSTPNFQFYLEKVKAKFSGTLFKIPPDISFLTQNLNNYVKAFLYSIFVLKSIL